MPLADAADPNPNFGGELAWYTDDDGKTQWKTNGKGELTGVTSINGAVLQMDVNDDEFMTAIGVKSYADSYGSAFGWYARAEGQYSVAVGYAAETDRAGVALGYNAKAKADGGTSLGMDAEVGEEHTNSVAIGSYSVTNAANQVSFGHKTGDNDVESGLTYKTDLFRSLTNISDIDMAGNINLGGEWIWNATSGAYESNGKGKLTGLTSINDTEVFIGNDGDALVVNIGAYLGPDAMGTISLGQGNYVDGAYAISLGYNVTTIGSSSVSIGAASQATKDYSTALGGDAYADGVDSTAIGYMSRIEGKNSTALGANSTVAAEHTNSVSIGSESVTSAADQVSFGHKAGDKQSTSGSSTYDTDLFRSLTNISDIDMHGNISLGGEWTKNATSGVYENNGKGELTGVTKINGAVFRIENDATVLGANADAGERGVAFGSVAKTVGEYGVAIGAYSNSSKSFGVALGYVATIEASGGTALGADALVSHENSVALGSHSVTNAANQVSFGHKTGDNDVDSGEVYETDLFRSLTNISDIEMHGALTGVTTVNGATITGTGFNGVTLSTDGKVNGAVITSNSFNGVTLEKGADSHYKVGGVDVTKMQTDVAGKADAATVTALDTRVGKSETDIVTLKTTVGDSGKGLVKDTADLKAAVGDGTTGLAAVNTKVGALEGKTANIGYAEATGTTVDGVTMKAGNIGLGGEWSWNDAGTSYISNGLGNLTGVTGINGIEFFNYDCGDGPVLAIGSTIGNDSTANSVGLGINTIIEGYGSVAIGVNTNVRGNDATGVGSGAAVDGENSVAVGSNAFAIADGATAVGSASRVYAEGGSALGYGTSVAAAHTNSVAIGAKSATGAANQVSFGHKVGDRNEYGGSNFTDDMFRSLVNVADIEMHGALTGVTGIDGVTVSGTDASTGLTVGGNAVIGKTDTPFSSTGFAVAKDGAVTAKTVNGAAITSNSFNGVTLEKGADSHYKVGGVDVTKMQTDVAGKADAATTLTGYGITDAYTKTETDTAVGKKADKATTLTGYGIADAYTKTETDTAIGKKADKATTLTGYGIADAYTKTETDTAIGKKADKATTLTGYGITDAYTKTAADAKITAATADMATKTQVTADIGTAKTALESAYQAADTALGSRSAALETKTAKFNTAGDNLTGMANITSTAATLGGVGFASAGVMTGVASIDGIAIDASRNLSNAGTYNGVTVAAAGISGTSVFNGAAITNNSFNGVTLEKGADNHYKVGGVDVSALKTTVDSISADGVGTADTAGIKRDTTGTATTTIETNTAISSSGITTNKATVSGATATTLENGKLTVGAATVQNTGFAVGSSSLNNGSLTVDGNNKLTTAGLTASKVTVGTVTVSGGKVSGLTDAALSAVSTEAVTGKQLNATNTTVSALDTAYQAADTQIRTDFAAADTTLQNNIDAKVAQTAYDTKMSDLDSADTALGSRAAALETAVNDSTTGLAAVNTKVGALDTAYQAADTALSDRAAALETAATGMSYDAGKNTTTFTGGVTATLLTAGEFKVGATGFGFGNDGALTAKTVNGIEIKKDESKVMVGGIDLTALSNGDVVTDNTKGIGRNQDTATTTIETNTAISSSGITTNAVTASGTVKAGEFVEGSQKLSDKYAAKTALADYTTTTDMNTKFADYATTTAVDTKLADYAKSDSVYSKAAADTAFAKAGDVDTLKTTVGDADGGLVKDVTELQSGKADKATTLAGYGIADAYTQTEINEKIVEATKDLATSATVTDIQSGLDEVTGKTAGLSYDTASGSSKFSGSVVIGNEGAKTHTQITDDAIIFGEGTDKQVTVDASGIHVGKKAAGGIALYADADGTHIDHTSLVTGSVTADNLNGVAISGNATDGLSVGGVSIKALSERLDSLEQDGVATADMGGIKRTDVVENSGKTIIEDTTSFTKDGLKTANLEAATAALGGVNFAAGAVTGVSSINGVVFGSDGKIGGVSLSGGKVDGVDVGWLDQRVKSLEDNGTGGGGTGGGGSSANTSGIHKPDSDTTNIEGNTSITTDGIDTNKVNASDSIVVADGEKNKTVISKDGILVAEGEKNQVKINEDGIHVGKNSSVVNDTDGFITDKGLYIGVSSSSDTSTAKFSVAPNGNLSSKAGDYGFSNTSADGAKFTHSGDTAYGTGSQLDTTIQGNKVTTGRIDTDELYVDGNKVTVAGGTIDKTDAVNNHLSGADADGNTVTNDFKTSAVNGTTQAAEKTSADGKESTKTVNNTSAGGTGVTTSKTTTDSKDNVTVKESSFGTNEKGMTLSTSNKVTDKDGKVTKDTSGTTTMTGDSISVSKTTTTTEKDADGNEKEVTKTSGTTIGSGEVTLKREDGSTIEVGSAIEGMQSDMRELDGRVNRMGVEIKEVGALSAALAGLHPQPENANSRADFAMAMGSYEGKQALAVGGFYRPDKRTMLSIGASTTSSKHMMNMGISIALDRLPEAERRAKEAAKAAGVEQETLNRVLERLAALEQDNRRLQADNEKRDVAYEKLAADYTQLKEKYIEETADRQQPEQAEAEE